MQPEQRRREVRHITHSRSRFVSLEMTAGTEPVMWLAPRNLEGEL